MRATWLHGREESRARAAALLPLHPAAWCYGAGARLHRALYSWGALERSRLPCQVVSVGSLAVGGTGKTPLAAWIATQLHRRGRKVVLASRGYGRWQRRSERVVVVSDGRFVHSRAEEAGDDQGRGTAPVWGTSVGATQCVARLSAWRDSVCGAAQCVARRSVSFSVPFSRIARRSASDSW